MAEEVLRNSGLVEVSVQGNSVSWKHGKTGKVMSLELPPPSPDLSGSIEAMSADDSQREAARVAALQNFRRQLVQAKTALHGVPEAGPQRNQIDFLLLHINRAISEFPPTVRVEANILAQHLESAKHRKLQEAERQKSLDQQAREREVRWQTLREEAARDRRQRSLVTLEQSEKEKTMAVDYLFTVYRAKWMASGGHPDPAAFKNIEPGKLKWAQDADREMKMRLREPDDITILRGTAMELFLGVEIEEQRWFDAEVVRVAAVDDFANGLDLALEWDRDEELGIIPRLAVDFTTAEHEKVLDKKLEKLRKGTSVNYFRSKVEKRQGDAFEGRIEDIPMVILGLDKEMLAEIGAAAMRGEKITPIHPVRELIVRQARAQVGSQIRELGARMMEEMVRVRGRLEERAGLFVDDYLEEARQENSQTTKPTWLEGFLRQAPAHVMSRFLGRREAMRLRHLLGIQRRLAEQPVSDESRPDLARFASKKIHRRLAGVGGAAVAALRLAGLGFLSELSGCVPLDRLTQLAFGLLSRIFDGIDRGERFVGRPLELGRNRFAFAVGHRVSSP
jgi:hypothetical protein